MQQYHKILSPANVPQTKPINSRQVMNSAGGYVYAVDDWQQLDRFLIMGTVGGTYYINERDLTTKNIDAVGRCISADPQRVLDRVVEVSVQGLALKNDPALFVLAMVAVSGDLDARKRALVSLSSVARIPTHLFHFMTYYKAVGGKSNRTVRAAVARWYNSKDDKQLVYQLTKYQSRDGWSNNDLIRYAHPRPKTPTQDYMFAKALAKPHQDALFKSVPIDVAGYLNAIELVHSAETPIQTKISAIVTYRLPREVIPTELFQRPEVWSAMLPSMPMHALVRNLAKMTEVGLIGPMKEANFEIIARMANEEHIQRSRMHPMELFVALRTYQLGRGIKGSLQWVPQPQIINALDQAIYKAYKGVEPSGQRILFALDVSGSMSNPAGGIPCSCFEVGAALMTVMGNTEPAFVSIAFDTGVYPISVVGRSINDVANEAGRYGGGTNLALPFAFAELHQVPVDTFVIFTDNETWAGRQHAQVALEQYRHSTGVKSRVIIVSAASNPYTVGDPQDPDVMNVVGFDASLPQIIRLFSKRLI